MKKTDIPASTAELARSLLKDLEKEKSTIERLNTCIADQLGALRNRERTVLDELTCEASQDLNALQQLQHKKEERVAKLAGGLGLEPASPGLDDVIQALEASSEFGAIGTELRRLSDTIPKKAHSTRERCKELAYSLQYALHLGHQFIEAIQGATSYPPMLIYTAEGSKKMAANKRIMINKVG